MQLLSNLRWWFAGQFIPFFRGPDPQHVRQRNIWHLYQDLLWLGFATAASTYINVYAIRLGASNQLLGLRTSIPSLLVVLLRIPAAHLMERTSDRKTLIIRALAVGRFIYFLIFLLPWLGGLPLLRQIPEATLFVVMVILISVPSVLSAAGWDSFFADVVPSGRRARVVGMRSTMTHVMMLTIVPLMGYFLDWVPFPLNYQLLFLLAFIGATLSTWHVKQIQVDAPSKPSETPKALNVQEARNIVQDSPEFGALLLGTFVYQWGVSLASPLYNVYFVEYLGASESWIGWRTTLASIASILAYRFWPRQVEQQGERRILTIAAPMMALFPLLTGFSRSLMPNLFIILIPRLFGSAVMLARYGILLRVCPDDRRPTYIAIYAILANIAAFIAPMVGVSLADWIGIRSAFFVSAAFRLVAAALYLRLPKIRVHDTIPAPG